MSKLVVAIASGLSVALLASQVLLATQVLAQPDTQRPPPGPNTMLTPHRMAALKKCTDGIKFESDAYVSCMTREGENP
jgi:hypothetical protein